MQTRNPGAIARHQRAWPLSGSELDPVGMIEILRNNRAAIAIGVRVRIGDMGNNLTGQASGQLESVNKRVH